MAPFSLSQKLLCSTPDDDATLQRFSHVAH